jgi:hypothetical protein
VQAQGTGFDSEPQRIDFPKGLIPLGMSKPHGIDFHGDRPWAYRSPARDPAPFHHVRHLPIPCYQTKGRRLNHRQFLTLTVDKTQKCATVNDGRLYEDAEGNLSGSESTAQFKFYI